MTTFPRYAYIVLFAAFIVISGCNSSTTTSPKTTDGPTGTLYFHESLLGIETMDISTGSLTTLAAGEMPNVRPDKWILGVIVNDLAVVSPNGTQKQIILPHSGINGSYDVNFHDPQLSPDGRYIAYDQPGFSGLTYIVNASTGALVLTIGDEATYFYYSHPSWGKDGSLYVNADPFNAVQVNGGIFKIDNTFQSITRVDKSLNSPKQPTVSPDGNTIAFILNNHLWTMGIDGSNAKQITTSDKTEIYPTWSPDSKWVAVNNGGCDLFLVPIGGGTALDLAAKFPYVIGGAYHCPSANQQMDWK